MGPGRTSLLGGEFAPYCPSYPPRRGTPLALVDGGPRAAFLLLSCSTAIVSRVPSSRLAVRVPRSPGLRGASGFLRCGASPSLAGSIGVSPLDGPLRCILRCICVSHALRLLVAPRRVVTSLALPIVMTSLLGSGFVGLVRCFLAGRLVALAIIPRLSF